jgi:hypothetical protein
MLLTTYESSRLLQPIPSEEDITMTKAELGGEDGKRMKKLIEELEAHVHTEMREDCFNYKSIKFVITTASRVYAQGQEKEKQRMGGLLGYFKSFKTDKDEHLDKINNALLNEIDRVSTFYSYEEIKMLSLSYDSIARLRDTVMSDLGVVKDLFESMELTLKTLFGLVIYIKKTLKDIKRAFNMYLTVMNCHQDKLFLEFVKEWFAVKNSTLRVLLEHEGMYKALYMAKFIQDLMEKEMSALLKKNKMDLNDCNIGVEAEEKTTVSFAEISALSEIEGLMGATRYLLNSVEDNMDYIHSTCLWHELRIPVTEFNDTAEMLLNTFEFYTNVAMTKDDYIQAKLRDSDEVDNYEEEPDKPSSDMLSLWMVILHTTFYFINYYGLYPVAYEQLYHFEGIGPTEAALCISITPIVATLLIIVYDWIYPRRGFRFIYIQSMITLIVGNLMYAASSMPNVNSLALCLIGRGLIGAGGVRVISKKYLAIFINDKFRQRYGSIFSLMGHLGKAVGPGISALLLLGAISANHTDRPSKEWIINKGNVFTIFCTCFWVVYFVVFLFLFKAQKKLQNKKIANLRKQAKLHASRYETLIEEMEGKELKKIIIESRKRTEEVSTLNRKTSDDQKQVFKATVSQLPTSPHLGTSPHSSEVFLQLHKGTLGITAPEFRPSPTIRRRKKTLLR